MDDERSWPALVAGRNRAIRDAGRWRTVRPLAGGGVATRTVAGDRPVLSFASNDYLGLSQHPDVVDAAHRALDTDGAGSGAARLVVGGRRVHDELEHELAATHARDAALLLPSGYQANIAALTALASVDPDTVIVSDELNHASIIDGCRLARAEVRVAAHRDVDHVDALLRAHAGRPRIVVTDAVFSMDGDLADVDALSARCRHHGALLVVDTAHAVLSAPPPADAVVVGTLSKTLGSVGGYVAAGDDVVDLLRNVARPFIFTTAGAPADAAAARAALRVLRSDEGAGLLSRLRANVERLRPGHPSPILPVLLGGEERAVEVADGLLERGLLVPAIRPPTVPEGTCRLRVAVSAVHEPDQLDALVAALDELGVSW